MNESKVAVIIPVYKVENYIIESVESVINQDYSNLDIILVDDGSPDQCPAICDRFASQYENVKAIHKDNGGLSSARNMGLSSLSEDVEYVLFLDSDDKLERGAIKGMVQAAISEDADVVIPYKYINQNENGKIVHRCHFRASDFTESPIEFALNIILEKKRAWRATGLLYSYKVIKENDIRFPIGITGEDLAFNLEVMSCSKKLELYKKETLICNRRRDSITHTFQPEFERNIWLYDKTAREFLEKTGKTDREYQKKADAMLAGCIVLYAFDIMSHKNKGMNYAEKRAKAMRLLNDPNGRNTIRDNNKPPYFDAAIKRFGVGIVYFMLRKHWDSLALALMSFI